MCTEPSRTNVLFCSGSSLTQKGAAVSYGLNGEGVGGIMGGSYGPVEVQMFWDLLLPGAVYM